MKYRIVKKIHRDSSESFYVQYRQYFIWYYVKRVDFGYLYTERHSFLDLQEALTFIKKKIDEERIKKELKIQREVMETYYIYHIYPNS